MKKKILSVLLSLCMVLTLMPAASGIAWADSTSNATSVTIGSVPLDENTPYYVDGAAKGSLAEEENWSAYFHEGTLELKDLTAQAKIEASGNLTIKLNGVNTLGNAEFGSQAIMIRNGNLTITGSGKLIAENKSNAATTVYADKNITVNGGAQVEVTKDGYSAQAIHAESGDITISEKASVKATNKGSGSTDTSNTYALFAKTIKVLSGATLEVISEEANKKQAIEGTVQFESDAFNVYINNSESPVSSIDDNTFANVKNVKIVPKDSTQATIKQLKFEYAHDVQRDNGHPTIGQEIVLSGLSDPYIPNPDSDKDDQSKKIATTPKGNWELTEVGKYSTLNSEAKSESLKSIVNGFIGKNQTILNEENIVIYKLTNNGKDVAYGVITAYDLERDLALFQGDLQGGSGIGYLLSNIDLNESKVIVICSNILTGIAEKSKVTLNPKNLTFEADFGYGNQTPKEVEIKNDGNTTINELKISIEQNSIFEINNTKIENINAGEKITFTVVPKTTGLAVGTYKEVVTIRGEGIYQELPITFIVKEIQNSASSGGSYRPSIQKPTIITDDGADATLNFYGDKLTIKAKDGYDLADVLLNGVSKGKVTEVTGLRTGDKVEVKTAKKQEEPQKPTKEEIIAGVNGSRLVARSRLITLDNGKKAIRITWYDKAGMEVNFDGVEVYRSVKKNKGYGKKAFYETKDGQYEGYYINTKNLKEGTRYYYKVRGYVVLDGQKYFTEYSYKAFRTVK